MARTRASRTAAILAAAALPWSAVAAPAGAQSPLLDPGAVVRPAPAQSGGVTPPPPPPTATVAPDPAATTPEEGGTAGTGGAATDAPPSATPQALREDPGAGSAGGQPVAAKRREARAACTSSRPPVNRMLAIEGLVATGDPSPWGRLALFVALVFAAVGLAAFAARRALARGRAGGEVKPRGTLETVSTLLAIAGALVALADRFLAPPPPREAELTVRDVLPRITRGEYARRTGADVALAPLDRREVGNVVLLQLRLQGYRGSRLALQYAAYSRDRGVAGALLPGTRRSVPLGVADEDRQTSFVPIWIGYPKSARFEAQFRLVEHGQIRELAATEAMRGSQYRYACAGAARRG